MKCLNDYMENAQTKAFEESGAFFAFSRQQFNEARQEGVKYADFGSGLICPADKVDALIKRIEEIVQEAIKQDVAENGKKNIIWRELANHECQIVGAPAACIEKLEGYPITEDEIRTEWKAYYNHCVENNYF